jgi:hypothetical protein
MAGKPIFFEFEWQVSGERKKQSAHSGAVAEGVAL